MVNNSVLEVPAKVLRLRNNFFRVFRLFRGLFSGPFN
jgi:hypothetical protein